MVNHGIKNLARYKLLLGSSGTRPTIMQMVNFLSPKVLQALFLPLEGMINFPPAISLHSRAARTLQLRRRITIAKFSVPCHFP